MRLHRKIWPVGFRSDSQCRGPNEFYIDCFPDIYMLLLPQRYVWHLAHWLKHTIAKDGMSEASLIQM